jgi:hypothetical protein
MKAILEFDLNDPDDTVAHLRAVKALDMALVLWEMTHNTKKGIEWEIESQEIKDPYEVLDIIMEKLYEEMNDRGIIIDELIQ